MKTQTPFEIEINHAKEVMKHASWLTMPGQDKAAQTLAILAAAVELEALNQGTPCRVIFGRAECVEKTNVPLEIADRIEQ